MTLYAHVRDGRVAAIQTEVGYAATHPSVQHLWQEVPEGTQEGAPVPDLADAPHVHPSLSVGEFVACIAPQELRDLYAADGDEAADPDIADFAHRLKIHVHSNTGIDRNSALLQAALDKMTKTKVPGVKPPRTYLTQGRRDQIMAAVRL